jgi:hypothetical protein
MTILSVGFTLPKNYRNLIKTLFFLNLRLRVTNDH